MAQVINVRLNKGEAPSLGFRLQGGKDFGTPLIIQKVNIGSPAEKSGLYAGDAVVKINNTDVFNLRHKDAQDVIIRAGPAFEITVQRGGSTWKPSVTPVTATVPKPQPASNSYTPVTKTSLAANPQSSIGAIGTGHNVSAKPFAGQLNGNVNGGPKLVNKQYNSPVGLYSEQSIAETLSAQTEVLATGVLGVNFKKNEKNYDASNSAVFRMVQEADKEPRDAEPEPDSGVVTAPLQGVGGLRHVTAPETKTTPSTPQLPPGQNICTACERLVTGVFVRIKDKNLHVECFKCATCGTSLKNVGYYNINNKLYCDIHAKLAARSATAPAANLVPVTVPPGGRAPAGTISAALSGHSFPSSAAPLSPSANFTPQPFQLDVTNQVPQTELEGMTVTEPVEIQNSMTKTTITEPEPQNSNKTVPTINGSKIENRSGPVPFSTYLSKATPNFSSPRPFSSVSAPLSPPASQGYSTLPRAAAPSVPFSSPAPSIPSSEKGRSLQNIIWPPPPDPEEPEIPTATPLYFPPPTHIRVPSPPFQPIPPPPHKPVTPRDWRKKTVTEQKETKEETVHTETTVTKEITTEETEEVIKPSMDQRVSLCSSEMVSIVDRKIAIEKIESAAETQMLVESVMKQRPMSAPLHPPLNQNVSPKVEVQTQPFSGVLTNQQEPRVVTRVCVCTNSCCNAATGELCESCPMRELKRPADYNKPKIHPVENSVPKRYGSPIITGVSVTINNPGKIKESKDPFTQIPMKRTTTALGSALVTAPKEPFHSITSQLTSEHVDLPEETDPYLPPDRPVVPVEKKEKPEPAPQPDTPFIQALRIAPERPFTPTNPPSPVYKKKPKEDPVLKDLPKPTQWMSMRTALTTASDRPYSPLVTEISSTTMQTSHSEMQMEQVTRKETQQEILKRSAHNESTVPKPYVGTTTKPVKLEKFDPVNDDRITPQMHFPPISDELKSSYEYHADYSDIKSEISSQIVEQAHLEETSEVCTKTQDQKVTQCSSCKKAMSEKKEERKIERQTEETILKKPMELTSYLHKAEYLPQYQMALSYDETIELPHHKDIKKLLQADQSKQDTRHTTSKPMTTYYPPKHLTDPQSVPTTQPAITKPVTSIQHGSRTPNNISQMSSQTINDEKPQRTSFSPRPGSLTPSMINKPAPTLPYYQENLIFTPQDIPEVNVFDPKSPAISRSPSPCPGRARSPSPFGSMSPRQRSPAPGPPPNPLKQAVIPTFTKEDRLREEAKKNICSFIPHHMERLDVEKSMQSATLEFPTQSSYASSESSERRQHGGITEDVCSKKSAYQTKSGHQTQSASYEKSCGASGTMQESKQSQQVCQKSQECRKSEETCQRSQECKKSEQMCQRSQAQTSQSIQQSTQHSSHQSVQQSSHQTVQQTSHQTMQQSSQAACQQSHQVGRSEHPFKQVRNPEVEPPGVLEHATNHTNGVTGKEVPLAKILMMSTRSESNSPDVTRKLSSIIGTPITLNDNDIVPPPPMPSVLVAPARNSSPKPFQPGLKPIIPGTFPNSFAIKATTEEPNASHKFQPPLPPPIPTSNGTKPLSNGVANQTSESTFEPVTFKFKLPNFKEISIQPKDLNNHPPKKPLGHNNTLQKGLVKNLLDRRTQLEQGSQNGHIQNANVKSIDQTDKQHFDNNNETNIKKSEACKAVVTEQNNPDLAPVCCVCNTEIERGPFISALGKIWCPDHFTCNTQSCRRPLQDLGFVEDQNGLFCEYCFEQYLAPPCSKCGSKIKGDCLKAIGKNFHPECFNCSYCGKLFSNSPFFLEDGQPYCESDWNELFTTKCFACGFPVEAGDRWLEALNNNYHSQCFNCTSCKKNLEGQKFFAKGGRPYCNNHAR